MSSKLLVREDFTAHRRGCLPHLVGDHPPPLRPVHHDVGLGDLAPVVGRIHHLELAGGVEAVAAALAAARDARRTRSPPPRRREGRGSSGSGGRRPSRPSPTAWTCGRGSFRSTRAARLGEHLGRGASPWSVLRTAMYSPFSVLTRRTSAIGGPARAGEALGGLGGVSLAASKATDTDGPSSSSTASGWAPGHARRVEDEPARRAVNVHLADGDAVLGEPLRDESLQGVERRRDEPGRDFLGADFEQQFEGTHAALPDWSRRMTHLFTLLGVSLRDRARQVAHAADEAGALGDADGAARVEEVEGMGALERVVVGGKHQPRPDEPLGLRFVHVHQRRRASWRRTVRSCRCEPSTSPRWWTSP